MQIHYEDFNSGISFVLKWKLGQ